MALLFLTNNAGALATGIVFNSGAADPSYSDRWMISGSRSSLFKGAASTNSTEPGYVFPSPLACDYVVVARADKLLTKAGMRVRPIQRSAGGTWSFISGVDYNKLAASDLVGPRSQDLVFAVTPAETRGIGLSAYNGGGSSEAMMFAKLYGCVSFSFGEEPLAPLGTQELPVGTEVRAYRGTQVYQVEQRISLRFTEVTSAKLTAFYAAPQMLNWPIFLLDTTAALWSWKLEHVLVENISEEVEGDGNWAVTIDVVRLRHYD